MRRSVLNYFFAQNFCQFFLIIIESENSRVKSLNGNFLFGLDNTEKGLSAELCIICQANMWLGTLLMERSDDIYRMKGLLSVEGMEERFVFQVIILSLVLVFQ